MRVRLCAADASGNRNSLRAESNVQTQAHPDHAHALPDVGEGTSAAAASALTEIEYAPVPPLSASFRECRARHLTSASSTRAAPWHLPTGARTGPSRRRA